LLKDPGQSVKSAAFSQYPGGHRMGYTMRTDRYRFTRWGSGATAPLELYDYQTDPRGAVNLAYVPEQKELVETLGQQLTAGWKGSLNKTTP
jgi:iduronate 2-sulfatase